MAALACRADAVGLLRDVGVDVQEIPDKLLAAEQPAEEAGLGVLADAGVRRGEPAGARDKVLLAPVHHPALVNQLAGVQGVGHAPKLDMEAAGGCSLPAGQSVLFGEVIADEQAAVHAEGLLLADALQLGLKVRDAHAQGTEGLLGAVEDVKEGESRHDLLTDDAVYLLVALDAVGAGLRQPPPVFPADGELAGLACAVLDIAEKENSLEVLPEDDRAAGVRLLPDRCFCRCIAGKRLCGALCAYLDDLLDVALLQVADKIVQRLDPHLDSGDLGLATLPGGLDDDDDQDYGDDEDGGQ